jgi:hypothetical protein
MKNVLAFLLLASSMYAPGSVGEARLAAGCGPSSVSFKVAVNKEQHPTPQPEPGKAIVYLIQQDVTDPNYTSLTGGATLKVGLDGDWIGATHGRSYLYFAVEPGEHRVCTSWQSIVAAATRLGSAVTVTAEPGKSYYLRAKVEERSERQPSIKLEIIDNAEGQFDVSNSGLSVAHRK